MKLNLKHLLSLFLFFGLGTIPIYSQTQVGNQISNTASATNHNFGQSLALDQDGNRIIVGVEAGLLPNSLVSAKSQVYQLNGSNWTTVGGVSFFPSVETSIQSNILPTSVDISSNGNVRAAGAPTLDIDNGSFLATDAGAAQVQQYNGSQWLHSGIISSGETYFTASIANNQKFGTAVALDNSGTVIASTAIGFGGVIKVARLQSNNVWDERTVNAPLSTANTDEFGASLALSGDGTIMVVGAPGSDGQQGRILIYKRSNFNTWNLTSNIASPSGQGISFGSRFGESVAVSDNGNRVVIGIPLADGTSSISSTNSGAFAIYNANSSQTFYGISAVINEEIAGSQLGSSIDISGNGNRIVVGAPNSSNSRGHVRMYEQYNGIFHRTGTQNGPANNGNFGQALTISGDGNRFASSTPGLFSSQEVVRVYSFPAVGSLTSCIASQPERFLREIWRNISGSSISNLTNHSRYPNQPDELALDNFGNFPHKTVNNYGQRIRGFIKVPATGEYQFNITGDDHVDLFLSVGGVNPADKAKIAEINGYTGPTQHNKYSSQTSATFTLQAGQYCYIEILHKQGGGGQHLGLFWKTPQTPPGNSWQQLSVYNRYSYECEPRVCLGNSKGPQWLKYNNISGNYIDDLTSSSNYPFNPSTTGTINGFQRSSSGNNYGQSITGYIRPATSGLYRFNLTGDDNSIAYLSGASPSESVIICQVPTWTSPTQHNKYPVQTSYYYNLNKNTDTYIRVLNKEGGGSDHVQLYWQKYGQSTWSTIPLSAMRGYFCPDGNSNLVWSEQEISPEGTSILTVAPIESQQIIKNKDVKIFPNPATNQNQIFVAMKGYEGEKASLQIFNSTGQLMQSQNIDKINSANHPISIENYNNGIYFMRVEIEGQESIMKKFVIQK